MNTKTALESSFESSLEWSSVYEFGGYSSIWTVVLQTCSWHFVPPVRRPLLSLLGYTARELKVNCRRWRYTTFPDDPNSLFFFCFFFVWRI